MFDLSMPELAVIGVVALLVLGPERLPGAARTVGALLRRAQRSWSGLRADIERELAADELKRQLKQTRDDIGLDTLKQDVEQARDAIARDLDPRPERATVEAPPMSFPGAPVHPPADSTASLDPPSVPSDSEGPGDAGPPPQERRPAPDDRT